MRTGFVQSIKKLDDLLELVVFDWALAPGRRGKTLLVTGAVVGSLAWANYSANRLSPEDHFLKGTELLSKRSKSAAAIEHLKSASTGLGDSAEVWQNLGHAYLNAERGAEAVSAYQRAVALDPSVSHLFFLGYGYVKSDLPEVAIGCYEQILEKNAFFYPAIAYQGVAYDKAGRYRLALQRFQRALAYNPNYLPAHFHMGITYVNTREYQRSIQCFEKVIQLDPTEAAAYYNIACCYSLMGKVDKALEWLERSVDQGFKDHQHMTKDTDLDNIRDTDGYRRLHERAKALWMEEAES